MDNEPTAPSLNESSEIDERELAAYQKGFEAGQAEGLKRITELKTLLETIRRIATD